MSKKPKPPKGYLDRLRNIGIIAHIDAGKTTLTERVLFYAKRIHRMGEVHDGTATMDFMPEEQERGITIASAFTSCEWRDKTVNIIDTPGHVDFTIEVERSLRVLDGAVGVFCAVGGVEPQSETVWMQSERYRVPKLAFINKMDRLGADFESVLGDMVEKLKAKPLPMQIPVGQGQEFQGVVDLLTMQRLTFDLGSLGEKWEASEPSDEEIAAAEPWRERLLETLAEEDESVLEKYLSGEDLSLDELRAAVRRATLERKLTPVFCGSALKNIGVQPVLDAVCDYLPSPEEVVPQEAVDPETGKKLQIEVSHEAPLTAMAFKVSLETGRKLVVVRIYSGCLMPGQTVYNVTQGRNERAARLFRLHAGHKEKLDFAFAGDIVAVAGMKLARTGDTLTESDGNRLVLEQISKYKPVISLALEPRNKEEGDRLEEILQKFLLEDPTLDVTKDEETEQLIISGMGELHLEVVLDRLRREYNLDPRAGNPQVVFQETITSPGAGEGEFDRELGETEHYGRVSVSVKPLPRDAGREVVFEMDTEPWPEAWVDSVAKAVEDNLQSGVLKGYPLQDVRVAVKEMRRKEGKSTPVGYHMAAAAALREALQNAKPVLLQPIMWLEVYVPEDFVGDVVGLLGAKGAKIENMYDRAGQKVVQALAPMVKLFGFSTDLRSASQGRAVFMMKFARFDMLE
jgi:elongation factor G